MGNSEIIEKEISLESARSRQDELIPSYLNGHFAFNVNSWGRFPCDYVVMGATGSVVSVVNDKYTINDSILMELYDTLPIVKFNGDHRSILRYGTMTHVYARLVSFIIHCTFYKACMRHNLKRWIEIDDDIDGKVDYFINNAYTIFNELPELNDDNYDEYKGNTVCIGDDSEWVVKTFLTEDNGSLLAKKYIEFVKALRHPIVMPSPNESGNTQEGVTFDWGEMKWSGSTQAVRDYMERFQPQYIDVPVFIPDKIDNLGQYTPLINEWDPNKKYYLGDRVRYNLNGDDEVFILDKATEYDKVEVPKLVYDQLTDDTKKEHETVSGITKYYYKEYYYKGNYVDGDKITYFDDLDSKKNISLNHWKVSDPTTTDESTYAKRDGFEGTTPTASISGVTINGSVSYIKDMMRIRKSFDDDGNELPFNLGDSIGNETELRYRIGNCNVSVDNDKLYADILNRITFISSRPKDGKFEICPCNITSASGGTSSITTKDIPSDAVAVQFDYYHGAGINDGGSRIENTGIHHVETYPMSLDDYYCNYSGESNVATYSWAEYDGTDSSEEVDSLGICTKDDLGRIVRFKDDGKLYICQAVFKYASIDYSRTCSFSEESGITYDNGVISYTDYSHEQVETDNFRGMQAFHDNGMNGIVGINEDIDVNIKRGTSSALERHNILSEVNTLDDLVNYRNNYFSL